ncbi:Tn3 family transposase [Streptomyces sp. NPDC058231]|uniref:Tn3 family transposase n=1 Tax=Streptomyces sp. NPDC058231 TaxID=3346392 RepID=UPI0036EED666
MARTPLDLDELVEHWTLLKDEQALVSGKRGATRLGFAMLLKFYTQYGRFARNRAELPGEAVEFVARQVQVPASELESYDWAGRTVEYHRAQIREHLGFRECSVADAEKLTAYLAEHVAHKERRPEQVRVELLVRCRADSVEPPTSGRCDRIVAAALRAAEESLTALISSRLTAESIERIVALVAGADQDDDGPAGGGAEGENAPPVLAKVKEAPGNVSLETMLTEIDKLLAVRAIGLPRDLFIDVAPKVVAGWRARAAVESPSHLRTHPVPLRVTLLAALLHEREREITDTLVELLISTVHRIGARAEKKVTEQLINAFKKVSGKENILFKLAEASLGTPEGTVRQVVFPAVSGGEATLRELVHEFKTRGPVYRRTVQTTLKASYTNHYRRGLIKLLDVLEFRSSNHAHRPVIESLALVARYANAGNTTYYPLGETVPVHKAMGGDWAEVVHRTDKRGRCRVVRMVYEVVAFQALRDQLKCKEIWVVGADKWRNPDEDLPQDFDARRAENYRELRKPLDAAVFVDELREQMTAELTLLNDRMPKLPWLDIAERKSGAIRLTAAEAQPEPRNLRRVKAEVQRRWGIVPLVDMLKEAVLRTGCLDAVTSVCGGGSLSPEVLAERLLLVIYAYGTNTGIKAVASGGHGHTEDELRYVRRRYLSAEAARAIAVQIANATFAARSTELWGQGSTAVASDSTHVSAYDQNLFTEWHSRYGGRGVLIYWHVEKKSLAIHSQLINCTASEVAAMIEGAMRHGTTMDVEANYTDSHGQSEIGFGITRLLNFDLLPRIKRINKVKLYRPVAGEPDAYPQLTPALTRPIRWELIAQQYDQVIKYATLSARGPRRPRRSCAASPATPPIPPTRRCWRSGGRKDHLRGPLPAAA